MFSNPVDRCASDCLVYELDAPTARVWMCPDCRAPNMSGQRANLGCVSLPGDRSKAIHNSVRQRITLR